MNSTVTGPGGRTPEEQRLVELLTAEAERVTPGPQGWARIQARVARPQPQHVLRGPRRRLALAVAATAVAAAVALVAGLGLRPDAAPQPAVTPVPGPSVSATPAPAGRPSVEVYRVRAGAVGGAPARLSVEQVATTSPYQPRQALDALFGLAPLAAADASVLLDPANVVASTGETAEALTLDMASVDEASRAASPALARIWVQAWVRTLQSAYNSDLPVLITVQGQPVRLYGEVDTTSPIAADPGVVEVTDQRIFAPRPGQRLTSPVLLSAQLPAGDFVWRITDGAGEQVGGDRTVSGGAGPVGFGADLPAGRYRASVSPDPSAGSPADGFRRFVDFVVTGPAGSSGQLTVLDPPTTPLDTVAVLWPEEDGNALVQEHRVRRDPVEVLNGYFGAPSPAPGLDPVEDPDARVLSVRATADALVVDFARLPRSGRSSAPTARRQATAFARTVQGLLGRALPVTVTLEGQPAAFLGRPGPLEPGAADLPLRRAVDPFPQPARPGHLDVVGRVRDPGATIRYSVADQVDQVDRFAGTVPSVDPSTGVYAFSLEVPAGRYLLTVDTEGSSEDRSVVVEVTVS